MGTRNRLATKASTSRIHDFSVTALTLAVLFLPGCQAAGSCTVPAPERHHPAAPDASERVCLSLRVLSAEVSKALVENAAVPTECARLGGIGLIEGFILDEAGERDIILIGRRSETRPSLRLDDLVVNMRGVDRSREYPFCSLDPRPEDTAAIQDLFRESGNVQTPAEMRAFFAKLKSAVGPQQVVIGGVPRDSRHAHVMIDADYHMKKVSQGHIVLPGVTSCIDRHLEEAKKRIKEDKADSRSRVSMSRFWFHIAEDCPVFQEDEGIVWLDRCPVVVLTEKQMTTSSGELYDVEEDDPIATAFAENLSKVFPDVAMSVGVYADLENLFRLRALLLAMKLRRAPSLSGLDFGSYLAQYRFQDATPMAPSYPGLANCREWSGRVTRGNMIYEYYLFPMACGGVGMDMEVADASFTAGAGRRLSGLRRAVLDARPSPRSLTWPVPGRVTRRDDRESPALTALRKHRRVTGADAILISRDSRTGMITVMDSDGQTVRSTGKSDSIDAAGVMAGTAVARGRRVQLFVEGFLPGEGEGIVATWRTGLVEATERDDSRSLRERLDPRLVRRLPVIVSKWLEQMKPGDLVKALSQARVNLSEFGFAPFEQVSRIWQRSDGTVAATLTIELTPMDAHLVVEGATPSHDLGGIRGWMRKVWERCKRTIQRQFGTDIDPPTLHERIRDELDQLKRELPPSPEDFELNIRIEAQNFHVVFGPESRGRGEKA